MEGKVQEVPECAVCLQSCNHPAQLPCGHIFCFLCAKGVAIQNRRCAMCRQDIPPDYLDHPVLIEGAAPPTDPTSDAQQVQWYYEGRNGWWKYDERSNSELEAAHAAGAADCRLLLAGALYHVDFRTLLQYRRSDATRRRRVKRDSPAAPAKGIAGIKMASVESERAKSPEREAGESDGGPEDSAPAPAPPPPDREHSAPAPTPADPPLDRERTISPPHPFSITSALRSLSLDVEAEPPLEPAQHSD